MIEDKTTIRFPHAVVKSREGPLVAKRRIRGIANGTKVERTDPRVVAAVTADPNAVDAFEGWTRTEIIDPRLSVEIWDDQFELPIRLYFEGKSRGPLDPRARLVGVEIGSEAQARVPLVPAQLTHLANNLPLYVAYARAELDFKLRPDPNRLLKALNEAGATRRGKQKPVTFYRTIADEYRVRVADGDSAPVTSIAKAHGVDKSQASRWLKKAEQLRDASKGGRGGK